MSKDFKSTKKILTIQEEFILVVNRILTTECLSLLLCFVAMWIFSDIMHNLTLMYIVAAIGIFILVPALLPISIAAIISIVYGLYPNPSSNASIQIEMRILAIGNLITVASVAVWGISSLLLQLPFMTLIYFLGIGFISEATSNILYVKCLKTHRFTTKNENHKPPKIA